MRRPPVRPPRSRSTKRAPDTAPEFASPTATRRPDWRASARDQLSRVCEETSPVVQSVLVTHKPWFLQLHDFDVFRLDVLGGAAGETAGGQQ